MKTHTDISENFSYFLHLMQAVLNNTKTKSPGKSVDWQCIYEIAINHSLGGMLYYAIQKLPESQRPRGEFMPYLAQMYREQIVSDLNLSVETERILALLSSSGIRCMPVKGIVTKSDYPVAHLRSMVDVDILYDPENRLKVERIFLDNGYTRESVSEKDTAYRKDEILHFEMHHSLLRESSPAYSYFSDIWSRAIFKNNTLVADMCLEDIYIYMLEHLAGHTESGGAGIRMFMDVYVFLHKHGQELNTEYVEKILADIRLSDFEKTTRQLCRNWFSGEEDIDTKSDVALFVLNATTFGKVKTSLISETIRNYNGSSAVSNGIRRILAKLFPSFSWMRLRFKAVDKAPVLYPLYLPVHWFDRLFVKRNVSIANIDSYFTSAESEDAKKLKATLTSLGLEKRI